MPAECRTRSFTHSHHPLWTLPSSAICSSTLPREAPGSCSRFCFSWPFSSSPALGGDDGGGLASRDRSPARSTRAAPVAALAVRARPTIVFSRRRPRARGGFMEPLPGPAPRRQQETSSSSRAGRGDRPRGPGRGVGGHHATSPTVVPVRKECVEGDHEKDRTRVRCLHRRGIPRPRRSESASGA
ncbi:MAG: hypothetical protein JWM10_761 [Myxococcaceae bacterium]|nr:hypothetical protein [Myxococcaceae bacterium]